MTIQEQINQSFEALKVMSFAELSQWAKENDMNTSAQRFGKFKKTLLAQGIDYDALRSESRRGEKEEIAGRVKFQLTLCTDAKASKNRFGITNEDGDPIWHGQFFNDEAVNQANAELETAKKAVWLAGKVAEKIGPLKLVLLVDAEWLLHANRTDNKGGRAKALTARAASSGLLLEVRHISGRNNPADAFTVCKGFKKYDLAEVEALLTPIGEE